MTPRQSKRTGRSFEISGWGDYIRAYHIKVTRKEYVQSISLTREEAAALIQVLEDLLHPFGGST